VVPPGLGISFAICLYENTINMFGSRPIIGCGRCFDRVALSYAGFYTRTFNNASGFYYVPDVCNCILGPQSQIHTVTRPHTGVGYCHGRISDGERYVGTVADRIGYRAINV
jgi:hypothetical protein